MEAKLVSPLDWPDAWPRTENRIVAGRFKTSFENTQKRVAHELRQMMARDVIISTNLKVRVRGPGFKGGDMRVDDPGVAVYFTRGENDKKYVFACDKFFHIQDNMNAIAHTIQALRGIERWGASDMMERAFSGFKALPETAGASWRDVILRANGVPVDAKVSLSEVQQMYRARLKVVHPDYGGSAEALQELCQAWEVARWELGGTQV